MRRGARKLTTHRKLKSRSLEEEGIYIAERVLEFIQTWPPEDHARIVNAARTRLMEEGGLFLRAGFGTVLP